MACQSILWEAAAMKKGMAKAMPFLRKIGFLLDDWRVGNQDRDEEEAEQDDAEAPVALDEVTDGGMTCAHF
jgi:hypothetical protein